MHLDDITPEKLHNSLYKRANTTAILFNSENEKFKEEDIFGPMDIYAENFFGEKKFNIKKKEVLFLKHVINIWYTEDEFGIADIAGNLISKDIKIEKMIVFSMWNEDYRDSLYLSEFNKIILLSIKLNNYEVPTELLKEEKDTLGRDIVKNKYKILDFIYQNNLSN
jgi:hypothetical protein